MADQLGPLAVQNGPSGNTVVLGPFIRPGGNVYTFIQAVLDRNWKLAFWNANGLSMTDLLKGMAALDQLDLNDLMMQQASFTGMVNMPRIQYAADVVGARLNAPPGDQALPASAPGDLEATGQVQNATDYVATRPRLQIPFDLTRTLPTPNPSAPRAAEADFQSAATALGVEVAAIHAITDVESGRPFGSDGRPTLRYELHLLYEEIVSADNPGKRRSDPTRDKTRADRYVRTHPHLVQPTLAASGRFHNGQQTNEWSLLYGAMILRPGIDAALRSPSYGSFQILGQNSGQCGAASVREFASDEFVSEGNQLKHFTAFVASSRTLRSALQAHDWATFAAAYNGPNFRVNNYDTNLAAAFARRSGHP